MRTTVDIEKPILDDVRRVQRAEGKTLGRVVSELLADALGRRKAPVRRTAFTWNTTRGRVRVDLADKDAVYALLDAEAAPPRR